MSEIEVFVGREELMSDPAISGVVLKEWEEIEKKVISKIVGRISNEFYEAHYSYRRGHDLGAPDHKEIIARGSRKVIIDIYDLRLCIKVTVYDRQLIPILKEELSKHADYMGIKKVNIFTV